MAKTEVYSWRLSASMKGALEEEARREGTTVAELVDRIVAGWLAQREQRADEDEEQARLHDDAMRWIGSIASGQADRSERARELIRRRLKRGHAR